MTIPTNRRSVMTLFSVPTCQLCHRVRIVLAEKDINVEIEDVDPNKLPEDILHLNPYGSLPTLLDRDLVLYDSRVICDYLDERFPHPPLMPVDPVARARSRLALHRIEQDWFPAIHDIENGGDKKRSEARKSLRESLTAAHEVFEHSPYFLSDEFTIVDVTMAPVLWRLPHWGIELPKKAKPVMDYADRIFGREGFALSLTEAERELRG